MLIFKEVDVILFEVVGKCKSISSLTYKIHLMIQSHIIPINLGYLLYTPYLTVSLYYSIYVCITQ